MDTKELRALMEAYMEVYETTDASSGGGKKNPSKKIRTGATSSGHSIDIIDKPKMWGSNNNAKDRVKKEQVDIYDIILSHLLDEGYAETLEQAEWMMANVIDEEAIAIILGEEQLNEISDKRVIAARNALAKRTDKANAKNDGNAYSRNVSREARMNARIQSRNQRTGSNVEPTFTRRHQ